MKNKNRLLPPSPKQTLVKLDRAILGEPGPAASRGTRKVAFLLIGICLAFCALFFVLVIWMNPPEASSGMQTLDAEQRETLMLESLRDGQPQAALIIYAAAMREGQQHDGLHLACGRAYADLGQLQQAYACLKLCEAEPCRLVEQRLQRAEGDTAPAGN